jgi:lysophospholipid acyltransferase (LPLAT)-like uncharacterized protein
MLGSYNGGCRDLPRPPAKIPPLDRDGAVPADGKARTGGVAAGASEPPAGSRVPLKERLLPVLMVGVIRAVRSLVRVEHHGAATQRQWERDGRRFVLAFWHRHILLMPFAYRGGRVCVLISASRDGERISRAAPLLGRGIEVARGSSSRRGAVGLRELLRRARDGWDLAFTPDGPRGPLRVVQPGVVMAAAATGLPVIPFAYAATRQWELRSWDRFVVPKPFSRVSFVHGEPLAFGREEDHEAARARLQAALEAVEAEAERRAGRASPPRAHDQERT